MAKLKTTERLVPPKKKSPLPAPVGPGPKPPVIVTSDELQEIQEAIRELLRQHSTPVTLRQIEAVVGYMIVRQIWEPTKSY
jgi:hypothetical protein